MAESSTAPTLPATAPALRCRVARLLEVSHATDRLGRATDAFLVTLILLNVLAIALESVPSLGNRYLRQFELFELFSVGVFTLEYLLRVWSCIDRPGIEDRSAVRGRLKFMITPTALIDLVAILPFYLSLLIAMDLRFLRVVRLLRIFKLTRYSSAIGVVLEVLQEEARAFAAAFFVLFVLLIVAASGIYLIERGVQPEAFGSIPAATWWAMATLTTVGYGDVTPVTPLGKVFGGFITIIGVGMVALPAGILASGFTEHLQRRRTRYNHALALTLQDGVVTDTERWRLEALRKSLDLDEEDARDMLERMTREGVHLRRHCPHCGKSLA